jgi:uncharacterized membrane protein
MDWFPWLLFLHVLGAIVAFGPVFTFPLIGAMGGREAQHANFATRLSHAITVRFSIPIGLTLPVTGAGMILSRSIDLTSPAFRWLGVAIVIYAVIITYAIAVQRRNVERIVELTSAPPPPGAAGPPPEVVALIGRVRRGGMFLTAGIVIIAFLMVVKPAFGG